jgi:S1-C subfamily serine protease
MHKHIKHLKRHRNILYSLVVILLIIQIVSFVLLTIQSSKLEVSQLQLDKKIDQVAGDLKEDTQYKISEIAQEIANQQTDFDQKINQLSASQQDFSEIIKQDVRAVGSIGTDTSAGTGFIVHSAGYIVTNEHVIRGARFIKFLTYDNKVYDATVIGSDATTDVALLKINGIFDHINLGNSDEVTIGEKVIAIGNPLGLSFTVTEGIVSAVHRQGPNGLNNYTQTDVALNPGNSGGPLIDKSGNVIGMNNFKITAEGLGFALESNVIKQKISEFSNITLSNA